MQISQRKIDQEIETLMFGLLLDTFALFNSTKKVDRFLGDILTDTERVVIAKRLAIALMIMKNYGYNQICSTLKVSPPTVAKVKTWLQYKGNGFRQVLKEMGEHEDLEGFWKRLELLHAKTTQDS